MSMDISSRTISVLGNFSGINGSILIKPGNRIKTISASKNILADTKVDEDFPVEFGIYDLPKFLAMLKMYSEQTLEFKDDFMIIRDSQNPNRFTRYYYSDSSVIISPPEGKEVSFPDDPVVSFDMTNTEFSHIVKGCSVMGLPEIVVQGTDGENITIAGVNSEDETAGSFNYELDVQSTDDFEFIITLESLTKLMQGDYSIEISEGGISRFTNKTNDVTYYVAVQATDDEDDD